MVGNPVGRRRVVADGTRVAHAWHAFGVTAPHSGGELMHTAHGRIGMMAIVGALLASAACTPTKPAAHGAIAYDTPGFYAFTVPAGVNQIVVDAYGAAGGRRTDFPGPSAGRGGRATAVVSVVPGETLVVGVGGAGGDTATDADHCTTPGAGGFNGGGTGGGTAGAPAACGGGGGGASGLARGAQLLVLAGGGGGTGSGQLDPDNGNGGGGGGVAGAAGVSDEGAGGGGGMPTAGGIGGTGLGDGASGTAGTAGTGGNGGGLGIGVANAGGGGGGGLFGGGGGGGASGSSNPGGGGGGSGFGPAGVVFETGVRAGGGLVAIAW